RAARHGTGHGRHVRRYRCGGSAGDPGAARRWSVAGAVYHHLGTVHRHPGTGRGAGLCPVGRALPGGCADPAQPLPPGPGRPVTEPGLSALPLLGHVTAHLPGANTAESSLLARFSALLRELIIVLVELVIVVPVPWLLGPINEAHEHCYRTGAR